MYNRRKLTLVLVICLNLEYSVLYSQELKRSGDKVWSIQPKLTNTIRVKSLGLLKEFPIDETVIVYDHAPYNQYSPLMAFDGTNYLVVWCDSRNGEVLQLYGTRLSPSGVVLDPASIPISTSNYDHCPAAVVFDGSNFFVVWQEIQNGIFKIFGARIAPSGTILDNTPIAIGSNPGEPGGVSMAFDGTSYLVVWDSYGDIYAKRISPSGIVLDSIKRTIATGANNQRFPSVCFDGTNYLVVWQEFRGSYSDLYGTRVSPSADVLDPEAIPISTAEYDQWITSIAFDGTNYFVVWQDERSGSSGDIYGTRVSPSGNVLDSVGVAICTIPNPQGNPKVAFDGTNFFVVWQDLRNNLDYDIYGCRVNSSGTILDSTGIVIYNRNLPQSTPSISFDGTNYLVFWVHSWLVPDFDNVHGTRVSTSGMVLDPEGILLTPSSNWQESPSVAFDGTNYLVAWQEYRRGSFDVFSARVNPSGTINPNQIMVSVGAGEQRFPSVTFGRSYYLVVWQDRLEGYSVIWGTRINTAGKVLDPTGFPITPFPVEPSHFYNREFPSVGYDGTNYFVVWRDWRSGHSDIYGARITPSKVVLDREGIAICATSNQQELPRVAFDGTNYLVVWQEFRDTTGSGIYGARVSPSGLVIDSTAIPISTAPNVQELPCLAFDGTNYLVVWQDFRSNSSMDIYGTRVSPSGNVLDPEGIAISVADFDQNSPAVAFDGTNFIVVWEDHRNGSDSDIYGTRVTPAGIVLDSLGLKLIDAPFNRSKPSIVGGSSGQCLIVYQGFSDLQYGGTRVYGAFYSSSMVGVEDGSQSNEFLPSEFGLYQNWPNPFSDATSIRYQLEDRGEVSLQIYNLMGQVVRTIIAGVQSPGSYLVRWDGKDDKGKTVPSGIYLIRLKTIGQQDVRKIALVR